MTDGVSKARQWLVAWIATGAICAAAAVAVWLIGSSHVRFLGFDVASGLKGTAYLSATVMCVTTVQWFRVTRRKSTRITVRELRERAGHVE
jgi:hypothetical protein